MARLNDTLTPACDRCAQEHRDGTGWRVGHDLVAWSHSLSDTESTREFDHIWINHIHESFHNCG